MGAGGASSPKPMVADMVGGMGVVMVKSLSRLIRSSRAYDVVGMGLQPAQCS